MRPSNEKIASGAHHEYSREKGYEEKPYEHQEFPKEVGGVIVNDAEEEAALLERAGALPEEVVDGLGPATE